MRDRVWYRYNPLMVSGIALVGAIGAFTWLLNSYWDHNDGDQSVSEQYTLSLPSNTTPATATPAAAPVVAATTPAASTTAPAAAQVPNDNPAAQKSWQQIQVADGDTLGKIFNRLDLSQKQLQALLALGSSVNPLLSLHEGQELDFLINGNKQLEQLIFSPTPLETLIFSQSGDRFTLHTEKHEPKAVLESASATIQHSLYSAGEAVGLDPKITYEVSKIFSSQLSLTHNVQPGDHFSVLYDNYYAGSKNIGVGDIIAAKFVTRGKTYEAVRYVGSDGVARYYTPKGASLQGGGTAFLRDPVYHARISSYYSLHRFNPVLHIVRPHYGVDFAAPAGTPIHASGDGVVQFAGNEGGYGRVVILRHIDNYTTLYAHMSHFARGLHDGEHVREGQVIGYLGSTGVATGPNLHYEVRINGKHYNPLTVKLPGTPGLSKAELKKFKPYANQMLAKLDTPTTTTPVMTATANVASSSKV